MQSLVDISYDHTSKEYNSSHPTEPVSLSEIISDKFDRDVYCLSSSSGRLPYINDFPIKKRKFIIVMRTNLVGGSQFDHSRSHYEVVGKLLSGNRIQREFEYSDPLIKRLHTFLYKPEKVPDLYPNLLSFLSKETLSKIGFNINDSDIEKDRSRSRSRSRSLSRENNVIGSSSESSDSDSDKDD